MEGNRLLPNLSIKKIWKKLTNLQTDVNELNSKFSLYHYFEGGEISC